MVFLQSYRKATKINHTNKETNFLHVKHPVPHKKELNAKFIYAHQTCISLKYRSLPHGHECLQVLIVPQCTSDRQLWIQTYHSQENYNNNIILWLGRYQSREINFVCQFQHDSIQDSIIDECNQSIEASLLWLFQDFVQKHHWKAQSSQGLYPLLKSQIIRWISVYFEYLDAGWHLLSFPAESNVEGCPFFSPHKSLLYNLSSSGCSQVILFFGFGRICSI